MRANVYVYCLLVMLLIGYEGIRRALLMNVIEARYFRQH